MPPYLIHLFFNIGGVLVFLVLGAVLSLFSGGRFDYGAVFSKLFPGAPQLQLAMFHTISDLERIGDYAQNIMEYADTLKNESDGFSDSAVSEIAYMREHIEKLFENVIKAYMDKDQEALAEAYRIEDEIDRITARMEQNHITRLNEGICTAVVGAQYMSLASNSERIADHLINVGKMVYQW